MKDIKTLYLFARSNKSPSDVNAYCEAVDNAFNNNHYEYVSNLEYIIPSGYGIKTFRKFIENNNLPIIAYDNVMIILEDAIKKYSIRNLSSIYNEHADYKECIRLLKLFKEGYKNSFMMFEAFHDMEISYNDYVESYCRGQFESNVPGMLTRFGEAAIPDVVIAAIKNNRADLTFKFLSEAVESSEGNAVHNQWLLEVSKDIKNPSNEMKTMKKKFTEESLEGIVESIKLRNAILYKESVVMDTNMYIEYSEDDINNMQNYIAFKEYYMTALDNFEDVQEIQNQIISVYEEFDGLMDEDVNDLIEMLPGAKSRIASEATIDKKYGDIPKYLKKHHDLSYGEDDEIDNISDIDDDIDHRPIDNYTRTPAPNRSDDKPADEIRPTTPIDGASSVNNYYYTYNNSFNKSNKDSHDILNYSSNHEKSDNINEYYDLASINSEIELILLESSELNTLILENAGVMTVGNTGINNETIFEKLKNFIKKVVEFLQRMWDNIIPKTFMDFIRLEKKFLQSAKMIEYLKANDNILPIQVIDVNNMDIWKHLIDDAESLLRTSMVKDNINYDQLQNKDQVIIFFKLYESDGKNKGMFMIGSSRLYKNSKFKNIGFDKKSLFSVSSRSLTDDNVFDILTGASDGMMGTDFNSYGKFKSLLKTLKVITTTTKVAEIINKNKYGDGAAILKRMLEELTILSKTVHNTMVSSYRSAVTELNTVNKEYTSKSHDNTKQESAPWELDVFPSIEPLYESASQTSWQKYYKVENESFKKVAGSILKDITSYFEANVEKIIKANPKLKYLDDPKIIEEIKTNGKHYNDLIGNAEYLAFDGSQEYVSLMNKYAGTELWETDKVGNFLIADLFLLMMKQFISDHPKYIEYFDIPLKYKGWMDESDDIPGISIIVKEPTPSIRIKIGSNKFKFKTDAWVPKDAQIKSAMSQVAASRLLYFMNKSKIEDGELGKEILGHLRKYNSTLTEDNLPEYVSADTICFKPQGVLEFTFIDKINKNRNITLNMNTSLKLQKMNVINEGVDIIYDESTIMNESVIGAIGTAIIVLLAMPIVLAGGLAVTAMIYIKVVTAENKRLIQEVLSKITSTKVNNINKYITLAKNKFDAFIDNKYDIIKEYFYKPNDGGFIIRKSIKPYYGWAEDRKIKDDTDRLLFIREVATGVIEKSKLPKLKNILKDLSDDTIQFTIIDYGYDLPGDDNGGAWSYLIKVGLIDKGPEDMDENDDMDDILSAAEDALEKYYIIDIRIVMQAKKFLTESPSNVIIESTDNEDPEKPISDNPIRDTLSDIDRKLTSKQQEVKKTAQAVINTGKVFLKPAHRTVGWIDSMVNQWKDKNENQIKERMADPRARSGLYKAIRKSIEIGSLFKARLLFNPIFMFLTITKKVSNSKNSFRIRNEMIGELKSELEIIDEKIKDADANRDNNAKYKLMRLKNEINKKLLRVDGGKAISKIL